MTLAAEKSVARSVALVGCGYWGKNLARNLHEVGVLGAICDARRETAEAFGTQYGVPAADFDSVLRDPAIESVVIAAPAERHGALARAALAADKHVLVEKPLALDIREAEELCEIAAARGRVLMVGHLLQYHPVFLKLREIIAEGRLGRLQYIYSNRLNLGKFRREENILWSFAPHDISMILSLAREMPSAVSASGTSFLHKTVADVTVTHLDFPSGIAAHVFVSWLHPYKEQKLIVVGDRGMAAFDDLEPWERKLQLFPHEIAWREGMPEPRKAEATPVPVAPAEPLRLEIAHFLDCIRTSGQPRTDGHEGLRVLQVLQASEEAIRSNRTVALSTVVVPAAPRFPGTRIHETAEVDENVIIGRGTRIWHFSHILSGSCIGEDCVIGQNVVIGPDVIIGNRCKIQNNVSVYKGVTLEDGVFCGPSMVFTNVMNPRAEIERKTEYRPTLVKRGATIGANATILCGITIGRYAMIGAGAVVTKTVPDFALVVGNPGRVIGWMSRHGARLPDGEWTEAECPATGERYRRIPAPDGNPFNDTVTEIE